jgi:TPR repeat protein
MVPATGLTGAADPAAYRPSAAAAREPAKAEKIPGEDEFLRGNYLAAAPDLTAALARGDIRGAFYSRIIFENGLDGRAPDRAGAQRAMDVMALRFADIRRLAKEAPDDLKPLYKTAVGLLYIRGRVSARERRLPEAARWLKDAADKGFTPAMNLLAAAGCSPPEQWWYFGAGTSDCFKWTRKAAEAGDSVAMANLSALYRAGIGTGRDPLMAVEWARRAAAKSPPSARGQNDMGAFYALGEAVSRDPAEARRWYNLAKARYALARENLAGVGKSGFVPVMERQIDY